MLCSFGGGRIEWRRGPMHFAVQLRAGAETVRGLGSANGRGLAARKCEGVAGEKTCRAGDQVSPCGSDARCIRSARVRHPRSSTTRASEAPPFAPARSRIEAIAKPAPARSRTGIFSHWSASRETSSARRASRTSSCSIRGSAPDLRSPPPPASSSSAPPSRKVNPSARHTSSARDSLGSCPFRTLRIASFGSPCASAVREAVRPVRARVTAARYASDSRSTVAFMPCLRSNSHLGNVPGRVTV